MFVPHVFVEGEAGPGQPMTVAGDDAHHLVRVLRLRAGDRVVVVTPAGDRWLGRLDEASPARATVVPERRLPSSEPPLDITLAQGLPKGAKMDEVIRHGTEVGIREFVPLLARRSVSRPDERAAAERLRRWQRIAREAARQAQRAAVPAVRPLTTLPALLAGSSWDMVLMPWEEEESRGLHAVLEEAARRWGRPAAGRRVLILIGPEGGWDPEEVAQARAAGARVVTLGPRILRTETAGVLTAGLVLHVLGDLG